MSILEQWKLNPVELDTIITANPSMRGLIYGYVAEYKLQQMWFSDERVSHVLKYDDHDRKHKGDLSFVYKGIEIRIEVKSVHTSSVRASGRYYSGRLSCDASDKRQVTLENGKNIQTSCLLAGEFDILAANLFVFGNEWRFSFAHNQDLPRNQHQPQLLQSSMTVTWPSKPPFYDEPFRLLDEIVQQREGTPLRYYSMQLALPF